MIKRIAAIVGLLVAFGAMAFVAIAIWPESAGNGETRPTGSNRTLSAAGGAWCERRPGRLGLAIQGSHRPDHVAISRRRSVPTTSASRCSP